MLQDFQCMIRLALRVIMVLGHVYFESLLGSSKESENLVFF